MFDAIFLGFQHSFTISNFLLLFLGVTCGIAIGSLPGLTATMGVAVLLPLTFSLSAAEGLSLLIGVYIGAIYGGSISAILLKTPGTPAAAATALDGYAMVEQGKASKALSISVIASFIGGITSVLVLMFFSPYLAKFALRFSAPEYFALAIFGLTIIVTISSSNLVKGLLAGIFGLLIATIGMDPITSSPRFIYGKIWLLEGFSIIPVLIGLFAIGEALNQVGSLGDNSPLKKIKINRSYLSIKEFFTLFPTMIKSALMGTVIGSVPGAGADIAAFVSYNEAQNRCKPNEIPFGQGNPKAIAAPEAGNNGVTGGALVPLLTLGVPGDAVAAILLGAFMINGIAPGPLLFQNQKDLVFGLFASMFIANFIMLFLGLAGIPLFSRVTEIPKKIVIPVILILSTVGAYAINNSFFDIIVAYIFGLIGFLFIKAKIPTSPVVLAIILGPMAETNLRKAVMMYEGGLGFLWQRPITIFFLSLALLSLSAALRKRKKNTV